MEILGAPDLMPELVDCNLTLQCSIGAQSFHSSHFLVFSEAQSDPPVTAFSPFISR